MSYGEIHEIKQLPWKLSAQTKGFQKAYRNFREHYGPEEGLRIFLQKAEEQGAGDTLRQKANSIYKTGATVPAPRTSPRPSGQSG
jgi:hypothetical protein